MCIRDRDAATTARDQGRVAILQAVDNRTVRDLNARARSDGILAGTIARDGVTLHDGLSAGVGAGPGVEVADGAVVDGLQDGDAALSRAVVEASRASSSIASWMPDANAPCVGSAAGRLVGVGALNCCSHWSGLRFVGE